MKSVTRERVQNQVLTIPNLLSLFRLVLIPIIIYLYVKERNYTLSAIILFLSGITDIADGYIARHFNMISDFGKIFDPIADKLTQASILFCLAIRYKYLILPLALLIVKEIFAGITGLMAIKKTGEVSGADWHGKATTVLLYTMMLLHIVWFDIPVAVSYALTIICLAMMVLSFILYGVKNFSAVKNAYFKKK